MKVTGRLQLHDSDQEKPSENIQSHDAELKCGTRKNGEHEKAEFLLALKQSYADHGMALPLSPTTNPVVTKSFHRKKNDPVTGKQITWVSTGKEKSGTLSSIVAVKQSLRVEYGKILYFIQADLPHEAPAAESACLKLFSSPVEDKESGLWYVDETKYVERTVPASLISRPLVTARDENDRNRLWILSLRNNQLDSLHR